MGALDLVLACAVCLLLYVAIRSRGLIRRYRKQVDELDPMVRRLDLVNRELHVLRSAVDAAHDMVVITNTEGYIEYVNAAFSRVTGYPRTEAVGRHTRILKSGEHDPAFYRKIWQTVLAGRVWQGRIVNRRRDGSRYREEQTITPVKDETGKVSHFIAIKRAVAEVDALRGSPGAASDNNAA